MPKVVVYVRSEDAKLLERVSGKPVADWVRGLVAFATAREKERAGE